MLIDKEMNAEGVTKGRSIEETIAIGVQEVCSDE